MLKLSKSSNLADIISSGDGSNPLKTTHPIGGSVVEVKVWLFNNDSAKRYENVSIDPVDSISTDESTWIQLAPDNAGVAGAYGAAGAALTMANVADSNVGHPFWVKVTSPTVATSQNETDIKLKVSFNEFAV